MVELHDTEISQSAQRNAELPLQRLEYRTEMQAVRDAIHAKTHYERMKRVLDIFLALGGIVLFLPLFLLLAIVIWMDDPHGSPIYISERCGKNGKSFKFYKFRSMYVHADQQIETLLRFNEMDGPVFKIRNDPRITPIGKIIRKLSLDEFPQFFNVLKGDMSIVGPRPPIRREVDKYTEYQKMRLWIKPGLTCYWQVQPRRNELRFHEWVHLDIQYILDRSLLLDLSLIIKTIGAIIRKEGM